MEMIRNNRITILALAEMLNLDLQQDYKFLPGSPK
jgi:hypothetical protein